ncbi:MAG: hypothetical protein ACOC2Q_02195 [Spirochaetota bacterium]
MVEIGNGKFRYRVNTDWARLPAGRRFGTTHGVVEDAAGRLYIHHTGSPSTFVFEPDGTFVTAWGEDYAVGAHGIHLSTEPDGEFLYLAATSLGFVAKTTLAGEELLRIETPPRTDIYDTDHAFVPTETTVAHDGTIYIADGYGQPWVHRYTQSGEYVESFGGLGSTPGLLDNPHGIMLDTRKSEPRILVSDRKNARLQYFTLDGTPDGVVEGMLRFPCTTIQHHDNLYIPDLYSRLTILGPDDTLVTHLADWPECWKREGWPNLPQSEWVAGKVSSPHDLHIDRAGNIYLAEWLSEGTGKVTKFERL